MSIDWSAFTQPVTPAQTQQWKAAAKASGAKWAGDGIARLVLVLVVLAPMILISALVGFLALAGSLVALLTGDPSGVFAGLVGVFIGLTSLALAALMVWVCRLVFPNERRWERWMRLQEFGRDNGLTFSPHDDDPAYPGAIFGRGGSRAAIDHFRPVKGKFFDFGNYQYVVSNGKSSTTVTWGFLAMQLDRKLPHMLLDSLQNNSWAGLGFSSLFSRDQVLSLEGDFNRYFTLFCPKQYERDALYVFTPDLMALCIDEAAPFDIEIVDDWMFVYSTRPLKVDDPHVVARIFRIIATVGAKALRQTDRYQDEKVAAPFVANVVASPGQRLRRRFPTAVIVVLIVVLVVPMIVGVIAVIAALAAATAAAGTVVG
jgi:hypothetical protein